MKSKKMKITPNQNKAKAFLFIGLFAFIGTAFLVRSFASISPNAKVSEAEAYASSQNTTVVSDTSASASSYLQFDAVSGGGGGSGNTGSVTHGDQLTESMVGPWALQGVAKGSERLQTLPLPSRGYWRMDEPTEFVPAGNYVYNNDPNNHGGTLVTDTMIDGYLVPAGTKVIQFVDMSASGVYGQGTTGTWLFRGVRSRGRLSAPGFLNNYTATNTVYFHYDDFGGKSAADSDASEIALQFVGGINHRVLRTNFSYLSTGIQPNVPGVEITENYIDKITYYFGDSGPCGTGGSCAYHLNGISTEGMSNTTATRFKILRNHITVPSPDEAGHITPQTDCIAMFQTNGGSYNDVLIDSNYLGGSGYTLYAGANPSPTSANNPKNFVVTNNKFTTRWWTNSGNFGAVTAEPTWGSNGNVATGNVWADDYGSGGNGNTPTSSRQYPAGNGPRTAQVAFGN